MPAMDQPSPPHTRRAAGCTGATTRPTTGHPPPARGGAARRPMRCTATCAPRTRSSTARAAGDPRGPPRQAGRLGGRAAPGAARGRSAEPRRRRAGRRRRTPRPAARGAGAVHGLDAVDCAPVRIGTGRSYGGYMDGSAGTVGRIMAPLLGVPERHHGAYGQLGIAFQHANFIRDVAEDWRLGRIYLPREDRERFGVAEADLAQPTASPELRALIAHEVERARAPVRRRRPGDRRHPAAVRPGVRLACAVYASVLDRVEAAGYDVLGRRMGVRSGGLPLPRGERCAGDPPRHAPRRRAHPARRSAPTSWSAARASPAWRSRASWPAPAPTCWSSTATRSASAPPPPAPRPRRGCTRWGCAGAIRQEIPCMAFHTPHGSARYRLPWSWSSFDYRELCRGAVGAAATPRSRSRRSSTAAGDGPHRPGGDPRAAGRRRARLAPGARPGENYQPPEAPLSRGLEVHPRARRRPRRLDRSLGRPLRLRLVGPGRRRAAGRRRLLRAARSRQGADARWPGGSTWTPFAAGQLVPPPLRAAAEDCMFFVGDSAGHCLPLSGEGIRTAFYFGIAAGGSSAPSTRARARERRRWPLRRFSEEHARPYARALVASSAVPALPPRALTALIALPGRGASPGASSPGTWRQAHPRFAAGDLDSRHMEAIAYDERGLVPCVIQDCGHRRGAHAGLHERGGARAAPARPASCTSGAARATSCGTRARRRATPRRCKAIRYDCDADAVLALVVPAGPACHTGERTCFSQRRAHARAARGAARPGAHDRPARRGADAGLLHGPPAGRPAAGRARRCTRRPRRSCARPARSPTSASPRRPPTCSTTWPCCCARAGSSLADAEKVLLERRR